LLKIVKTPLKVVTDEDWNHSVWDILGVLCRETTFAESLLKGGILATFKELSWGSTTILENALFTTMYRMMKHSHTYRVAIASDPDFAFIFSMYMNCAHQFACTRVDDLLILMMKDKETNLIPILEKNFKGIAIHMIEHVFGIMVDSASEKLIIKSKNIQEKIFEKKECQLYHQQLRAHMKNPDVAFKKALAFKEEGNKYFTQGNFEKALESYTKGIDISFHESPMCPSKFPWCKHELLCNRGKCHLKLGNLDEALKDALLSSILADMRSAEDESLLYENGRVLLCQILKHKGMNLPYRNALVEFKNSTKLEAAQKDLVLPKKVEKKETQEIKKETPVDKKVEKNEKACIVCGNSVSKSCSCKRVRYCSQTCQRMDWNTHKENCKKWREELEVAEKELNQ
jgi:tetratricopeptide (TPR) repeat protein